MRKCLIFVCAVAFVAACVLPAMAQEKEVSLYGSVRMETFWRDYSKEQAGRGGVLDRSETQFEIGDSSRFGANFKQGNLSANVELRPYGGGEGGTLSSDFRQWWGQVDFSGWQLRVGQQSVIDGLFPPGCCIDEGSVQSAWGGWSGRVRQPGLAAFIPVGQGTFKLGLFATGDRGDNTSGAGTALGLASDSIDVHIPQIQLSYDVKLGPASLKFIGGYNTYDEVYWAGAGATSDVTYSVKSWVLGGEMQSQFGPLTLMWQLHYAVNQSGYNGSTRGGIILDFAYDSVTNDIEDVKEWGTFARILYKMSDLVTWELGGGYHDQDRDATGGLNNKVEWSRWYGYLNAQVFLAKTFRFTPEVGYFDFGDRTTGGVSTQQGSQWYLGAYWRIDF